MPFINGRYYMNPAYGRALEAAREAGGSEDEDIHWVTIDHRHVPIQEGRAGKNSGNTAGNGRGSRQERLDHKVTIGGLPNRKVIQPPTVVRIIITPNPPLPAGTYTLDVSLTQDTTDADNGKPVNAELAARVGDATGGAGSIGSQPIPATANRIPVTVGVSAPNGDFHYEGEANLNVVLTGSNGINAGFSAPVILQRGNQGAASVAPVSGRTVFRVGSR